MGSLGKGNRKLCIVTPDLLGPVRNGGIGTACYWLAQALAQDSYEVTVLFAGTIEAGHLSEHERFYRNLGVRLIALDLSDSPAWHVHGGEWFMKRSQKVRDYLVSGHFDIVLFQDWRANGFMSIRAKKTGLGFQDTVLMVEMHGPTAWNRDGNRRWPEQPMSEAILDYCERYCCENSDILVSPSRYMFQWAEAKGWHLPERRQVVPHLCERSDVSEERRTETDEDHLVFFGRLETRKGLELFCEAIDIMLADPALKSRLPRMISFLGNDGLTGGYKSGMSYAKTCAEEWKKAGIRSKFLPMYDSFRALDYLKRTGAIAVIPSLVDNYPYTVIECLVSGIPFLASAQGGIPEMVSRNALFGCDSKDVAEKLANRRKLVNENRGHYSPGAAHKDWLSLLDRSRSDHRDKTRTVNRSGTRTVSVCISYYNLGQYFPQLLRSLAESDYDDFQVIAVNDGSTTVFDNEVFQEQKEIYRGRGWNFYETPNKGVSAARNFAAAKASGRYLIFMDADNIAVPTMISDFSRAMEHSGADCLTAHFLAFSGSQAPDRHDFKPHYGYWPVGGCITAGLVANVFGDANLCIERDVFQALDGFNPDVKGAYEDWEFLARLCLRGYKLDVIPKDLFYYRHRTYSRSRTAGSYPGHLEVSRAYLEYCDSPTGDILTGLTIPLFHSHARYNVGRRSHVALERLLEKIAKRPGLEKLLKKLFHVIARMNRPASMSRPS